MLHQTFPILGQLWQLFEVSQILEFLRYIKGNIEIIQVYWLNISDVYLDLLFQ